MTNVGINNRELFLIKERDVAEDGQIVVVLFGDEVMLKYICK